MEQREKNYWDERSYARMVSAQKVGRELLVLFEDQTWVRLDANRLVRPGVHGVCWNEMTVTPYDITIPTDNAPIAVPWLTIRALTDAEFDAYLVARAAEEARRMGQRIRDVRRARGLSAKEVAERAGIAPQSLSRIELGQHGVVFTTLRKVLAAMGCSLRDLTSQQAHAVSANAE